MSIDMKHSILQALADARRLIVSACSEHEHVTVEGRIVRVVRREVRQIDEAARAIERLSRVPAPAAEWDLRFDDPRVEAEYGEELRRQRREFIERGEG